MPNGEKAPYNEHTKEITLNDVYLRLGGLESSVRNLHETQTNLNRKLDNIAAVANQPHECKQEELLKSVTDSIAELEKETNKAIGGKAMLVFLIMLLVSVLGLVTGVYFNYQNGEKLEKLEQRVDESNSMKNE